MKFIIKTLLIGIAAFFCLKVCPWWIVLVAAFTMNLVVKTKGAGSFFSSFLGVTFAWFLASYMMYSNGAQEFSDKMAKVFLPVSGIVFIIITSALIGLVGALSGFTGNAFRNIFIKPKTKNKSKYGRPDYSRYSR